MRLLCLLLCGFPEFTKLLLFYLWVDTHGLGVHKAASGACCCAAHSQGPRHGIGPLAGRCRYPRSLPYCTSGTDKSLPHRCGLRWLVWKGRRAEVEGIIQNMSSFYFTGFIVIYVAWGNCFLRICHHQFLGIRECIVLQKKKRRTVSYLGLSQSRVRNLTPPPQVREHCPNSLHEPQFPSCFIMSGVSQMQWPLKQCCDRQKTQDRFSICLILA